MRKGFLGSLLLLTLSSSFLHGQGYPHGPYPQPYYPNHPGYHVGPPIAPVGFFRRDPYHGVGVFQRLYDHMRVPPQPNGPIQTTVNGHLAPPPIPVVGEDTLVGSPNQPYLHDDVTDYQVDQQPVRTYVKGVISSGQILPESRVAEACPEGGCLPACEGDCVDECAPYIPPEEILTFTPPGHCLYGGAEFVYWMMERNPTAPLLSVGPLGAPGSQVLVNSLEDVDDGQRMGGRFTVGFFLDPSETASLEGSFVFLGDTRKRLEQNNLPNGAGVPFFDITTGNESLFLLGVPGSQNGFALLTSTQFWSVDVNYRNEIYRCAWFHFDLVAGLRVIEFEESLAMSSTTTVPGTTRSTLDEIDTINMMYGGQVGFLMELHKGRWFLNLWNKTMLGVNRQDLNISGTTNINGATFSGGIINLPSNIGSQSRNRFAVVPELGINAGFQVCDFLRINGGYTAIYLNSVLRSGDQIDRVQNRTQQLGGALVGPARPAAVMRETDMWIHGWNAGMELRY